MNRIIHFETLGCRLNQDETEGAARCFFNAGFSCDLENITAKTEENENVILSVINTCTVTAKAEQKARRIMRLLLDKYKKSLLIVTGCYAEVEAEQIKSINPQRILIVPGTKKFLLSYIADFMKKHYEEKEELSHKELEFFINQKIAESEKNIEQAKKNSFILYTPVFEKHSRASIKIQDGCNNNCAFCRIHLARGKSTSLEVAEVIKRIQELEKLGKNEVVFTGVNLTQYAGKYTDENGQEKFADFADLLKFVLQATEKIHLRISSLYPQSVNEKFCEVIKDKRVAPSFHLSVQSGSDNILSLMNRPYKSNQVLSAIENLRKAKENPFISCDIIGGFPGESEEDFKQTEELCIKAKFAWIHAFPFSPRPGTKAYSMKGQIPERIKDERVKLLTKLAVKGKVNYIDSFIGKKLTAVVENNRSERLAISSSTTPEKSFVNVVTDNFLHVKCEISENEKNNIPQRSIPQGTLVQIEIIRSLPFSIEEGRETEAEGKIIYSALQT